MRGESGGRGYTKEPWEEGEGREDETDGKGGEGDRREQW